MQAECSNDTGPTCQTTETCETSLPCQLTLLPEDSPANRSALPGSEQARQMTVTSGRKCSPLCDDAGPLGYLVKMCLESSIWHSNRCVLTWKEKAMPSGRWLFRLVPSVHGTDETGFGLWPTMAVTVTGGPTGLGGGSGNRAKMYRILGKEHGKAMCCGSLNPTWAEWFMGYPMGHTECDGSETP